MTLSMMIFKFSICHVVVVRFSFFDVVDVDVVCLHCWPNRCELLVVKVAPDVGKAFTMSKLMMSYCSMLSLLLAMSLMNSMMNLFSMNFVELLLLDELLLKHFSWWAEPLLLKASTRKLVFYELDVDELLENRSCWWACCRWTLLTFLVANCFVAKPLLLDELDE